MLLLFLFRIPLHPHSLTHYYLYRSLDSPRAQSTLDHIIMANVTPADVNTLQKPTDGFLCSMSDNKYGIEFLSFCISDYDTKDIIFEVGKGSPPPPDMSLDFSTLGEDMYRKIKYTFSEDVLKLPFIQTT